MRRYSPMRVVQSFFALALVLVLAASAYAGDDKGKKPQKEKKNQPVAGRVTAVEKDKGTLTVKVQPKVKKGTNQSAPAVEQTFKVTGATRYHSAGGKKGAVLVTTATLADVKVGVPVAITHKGNLATEVTIQQGKTKAQPDKTKKK